MPRNQNTTKIRGFAGLVNTVSPEDLSAAERDKFPLLGADNVYLTNARRLKRRQGYTLSTAGSYHSLWSGYSDSLVCKGMQLVSLDTSLAETVLRSDLVPNSPMSYAEASAGRVYYMNAHGQRGSLVNGVPRAWGLPALQPPRITQTTGGLSAGEYRVAVTQRLASGEESGVADFAYVRLAEGKGIDVTVPPLHPDTAYVSVYCSLAGGETLYEVARVSYDTAAVVIRNTRDFGQLLKTLDVIEPPAGQLVAYHAGRLYVANDGVVMYSDPFAPGWFRDEQFFAYPEPVTLMAPVDGGMYISADKTYYLAGDDPKQAEQTTVSDAKAVKGTLNYLQPGEIEEIQRDHAVWLTDRGFVIGAPGGALQHVSEGEFTFAVADNGALGKIRQDGVTALVGLMQDPGNETNDFGMTDRVSAEIIRNKVV